jgi:hypothetical protein
MATTISASTTSNTAYNVVPDTSGSLAFQTGATPTTALTISSSQVVSLNNDATIHGLTVGQGVGSVSNNTAVGLSALAGANSGSGYNTAVGYQAGYTNTSGTQCDAFGANALYSNTTSQQNASFGNFSSYSNTTGSYNSVFGVNAFYHNTTGANNTALGWQSLFSNATSSNSTAVGYQAGYSQTALSANNGNTFIGHQAGYSVTTGNGNTFIGPANGATSSPAGYNVTTGSFNTIIGGYTGNNGGLNITTSSNYIVLSDGAGNPRQYFDGSGNLYVGGTAGTGNSGGLLYYAPNGNSTGSPQMQILSSSNSSSYLGYSMYYLNGVNQFQFYVDWGGTIHARSTSISSLSDQREKTNIKPLETGLAEVLKLQPRRFDWIDGSKTNVAGFIAQEVQAVLPDLIDTYKHDTEDRLGLRLGDIVPTLVSAIQELNTLVTAQATTITALEAKLKAANVAGF